MKILLTVIFTILGLIIIALIFIYSGSYNVSAMNQETGLSKWILNTTMEKSIESRSEDIRVPNLNDSSMIRTGLVHYKEMCEICHEAPGKEESELAKGLNPGAPDLVKYGPQMDPAEIFWVTKYGIKMTGMPAWGITHSDNKIWAIVAAVRRLGNISPEEYNSITTGNNKQNQQMQTDEHTNHQH